MDMTYGSFTAKYPVANINELILLQTTQYNLTKNEDRILKTRAEIKESLLVKKKFKHLQH